MSPQPGAVAAYSTVQPSTPEWTPSASAPRAATLARIATGELSGDGKTLLRNPRFVTYLRRAKSDAGSELSLLRDDAHSKAIEVIANVCDVEQARPLISQ
ncbi:MAG: hypothetical protein WCE80_15285 [Acidimicrobiia bacterium]